MAKNGTERLRKYLSNNKHTKTNVMGNIEKRLNGLNELLKILKIELLSNETFLEISIIEDRINLIGNYSTKLMEKINFNYGNRMYTTILEDGRICIELHTGTVFYIILK